MTAAQVECLFRDYADAFSSGDIGRIEGHWAFPAFMAYDGRQAVLDREEFRANAARLCAFYAAQGVVRADKEILALDPLTATTASVRTADRLWDADGRLVAQWEHVYLLSDTPDGVKVAAALPDNELRAWRERGTPLGG